LIKPFSFPKRLRAKRGAVEKEKKEEEMGVEGGCVM
jgi:hypothetical protein